MKIILIKKIYHIFKYFTVLGVLPMFLNIFFSNKLKNKKNSTWIIKNNLSPNFKNKFIVK